MLNRCIINSGSVSPSLSLSVSFFLLFIYSFTDNRFFAVLIRKYIFGFYPSFKPSVVFASEKSMIRGNLLLLFNIFKQ